MLKLHRSGLAAFALFAAIATFASAQEATPKLLFEKSGELTDQDEKDKLLKASYAKVFTFKMDADKAYRIDLASKDFTPVIRLESPGGKQLMADAKSGEGGGARVVFKAPLEGEYRIIVTTLPTKGKDAELGKFQLTVTEPNRTDLLAIRIHELPRLPVAERTKTLEELLAHLEAKGKNLSMSDGKLVFEASQVIEMSRLAGAGDWCMKLSKALEPSDNIQIRKLASTLAGTARRLRLPGNTMELTGNLLDGSKFDWSKYRGKVVLVDFWATWCGPCVGEIPNMKRMYKAYHDKGFDIVGISLDRDAETAAEFMKKRELPWACLFDEKQPLADYYGINAIPVAILVDKEGKVVSMNARGPELDRLLEQQLGPLPEAKTDEKK